MVLTHQQRARIRILHEVMGALWSEDLDRTIKNFEMDADAEYELSISERAAATYLIATKALRCDEMKREECWTAILDLLLGRKAVRRENLSLLAEDEVSYIETVFRSDLGTAVPPP